MELTELGATAHVDNNGTLPEDNAVRRYLDLYTDAMTLLGRPPPISSALRSHLEDAGFVDIHIEPVKQPLGSWPQGKKMHQLGVMGTINCETAFHAYGLSVFTKVLGMEFEAAEKLCTDAYNVIKDGPYHIYTYL